MVSGKGPLVALSSEFLVTINDSKVWIFFFPLTALSQVWEGRIPVAILVLGCCSADYCCGRLMGQDN